MGNIITPGFWRPPQASFGLNRWGIGRCCCGEPPCCQGCGNTPDSIDESNIPEFITFTRSSTSIDDTHYPMDRFKLFYMSCFSGCQCTLQYSHCEINRWTHGYRYVWKGDWITLTGTPPCSTGSGIHTFVVHVTFQAEYNRIRVDVLRGTGPGYDFELASGGTFALWNYEPSASLMPFGFSIPWTPSSENPVSVAEAFPVTFEEDFGDSLVMPIGTLSIGASSGNTNEWCEQEVANYETDCRDYLECIPCEPRYEIMWQISGLTDRQYTFQDSWDYTPFQLLPDRLIDYGEYITILLPGYHSVPWRGPNLCYSGIGTCYQPFSYADGAGAETDIVTNFTLSQLNGTNIVIREGATSNVVSLPASINLTQYWHRDGWHNPCCNTSPQDFPAQTFNIHEEYDAQITLRFDFSPILRDAGNLPTRIGLEDCSYSVLGYLAENPFSPKVAVPPLIPGGYVSGGVYGIFNESLQPEVSCGDLVEGFSITYPLLGLTLTIVSITEV